MNCLEFLRTLKTEPACQAPDFLRHPQTCGICSAHAVRLVRFEDDLQEALRVVETPRVPDGLASRILSKHTFEQLPRSRWGNRALALAAGVLLTTGLVGALLLSTRAPSLAQEVIAHVENEPHTLRNTGEVAATDLRAVLAPLGAELTSELGRVTYAGLCTVRNRTAAHIVLRGKKAPVTVLLMPGQRTEKITPIEHRHFVGNLSPSPGGSVAVVGESGATVATIEARLRSTLRWRL